MNDEEEQKVHTPNFWLIKIDERPYWVNSTVLERTTANYGVYAVDRNSCTRLCEITPSYALFFVANVYEEVPDLTEEQREELDELVMTGGDYSEPVTYMHVRTVEKLIEEYPERARDTAEFLDIDFDDECDEPINQITEAWATGAATF